MKNHVPASMPAVFIGHGNPMLTIGDNRYVRGWAEIGQNLPLPKAILTISAHWYIPEMRVTAMKTPRTIHDFYGFPDELFQVEYPATGNPELAEHVADLLLPDKFEADHQWGLDHGTWAVLRHLYPHAQVPVIQLSLDLRKSPEEHFRIGQKLTSLRKEGVLIVGSGNIVHNLQNFDWRNQEKEPQSWAVDFEAWNKSRLLSDNTEELANYLGRGEMAQLSAPTPDHYLPLLYLAALKAPEDAVSFPVEGFDGGTMSMLSVLLSAESET
ncbi:Aromatic ring-opening dioxygenase, catalytic subunit, LigB family [Malonomonas rubra DSM 5091]|uniref:Aromatic ring-opening dioxygenase, catalytic subunit, LigB family n=1 Tax=Malonomonas rubra DSM 5091 TaxID=1122189 RepID=A0A1M6CDJ9_MALRU|nr:4,5-DOPA dioxygenase extradiol [Malonomonas rubra]SHI58891.1 Aromatic ring-opening dioxygenase, catalytic subunit, LigB family [Malonomonas rubra DSM 5091]